MNDLSYNKVLESHIRGRDLIPATYGNVSLYTTGKTDFGSITTKNLAINKNNTANALDVSGSVVVNGSITLNGEAITNASSKADKTYVDASLNLKADKTNVDASLNLKADKTYVDASLNLKADQTYVNDSLNLKADQTYVNDSLNLKADQTYVNDSLNLKADQTYVNDSLNTISEYLDNVQNFNTDHYGLYWTYSRNFNQGFNNTSIAISSTGKYQTIVFNNGYTNVSNDYGKTWSTKFNGSFNCISISSDGKYQIIGPWGSEGIRVSNDYGNNWTTSNCIMSSFCTSVSISSNGQYQTAIDAGNLRIAKSSDYGNTWTYNNFQDLNIPYIQYTMAYISMSASGKYQTFVTENNNIYISDDYGNAFNPINPSIIKNWKCVSLSSSGKYQTAVASEDHIYISSDYGNTWTQKIIGGTARNWISVSLTSSGQYQTAVVQNGNIFVSNDYGNLWTDMSNNGNWSCVAVSSNGHYQTACELGGTIYVSNFEYANKTNVDASLNLKADKTYVDTSLSTKLNASGTKTILGSTTIDNTSTFNDTATFNNRAVIKNTAVMYSPLYNGTGQSMAIFCNANGEERHRILDEGAFGDAVPKYYFSSGLGGCILTSEPGSIIDIHTGYWDNGGWNDAYAGSLSLYVGGTKSNGITIKGQGGPLGYVGIRTTNPSYPLDVVGDARFQNDLYLGSLNVGTKFSNIDESLNSLSTSKQPTGNYMTIDNDETIPSVKSFTGDTKFMGNNRNKVRFFDNSGGNEFLSITLQDRIVSFNGLSTGQNPYIVFRDTNSVDRITINQGSINCNNSDIYTHDGGLIRKDNMYLFRSNTTINEATTITKPFNSYYSVAQGSTAFTITLPTIVSNDLGASITFRKIQSGTASISFIGSGGQKIYAVGSTTGSTTAVAFMTTNVYSINFVALLETGGTTYGWYQIVSSGSISVPQSVDDFTSYVDNNFFNISGTNLSLNDKNITIKGQLKITPATSGVNSFQTTSITSTPDYTYYPSYQYVDNGLALKSDVNYVNLNFMNLNTDQSVSGHKTFNNNINIYNQYTSIGTSGSSNIVFKNSNNINSLKYMTLTSQGALIVSNSNNIGVSLDANASSWSTLSDSRLKTEINNLFPDVPISPMPPGSTSATYAMNPLEVIKRLRPVSFKYNSDLYTNQTGFIAQDVEKILPGLISEIGFFDSIGDNVKGINYNGFTPYLVGGIQQHDMYINNINTSINSLTTYVDSSLNLKADKTYLDTSLNSLRTYVDSSLNSLKTYVDSSLNLKANQTYVDNAFLSNQILSGRKTINGIIDICNNTTSFTSNSPNITFTNTITPKKMYITLSNTGALLVCDSTGKGAALNAGSNAWTTVSDSRLKTEINNLFPDVPISPMPPGSTSATYAMNPLEVIKRLRPVSFKYNSDLYTNQTGFIAQEVEEILPGLISEVGFLTSINDNIKGINYNGFTPYLVGGIQQHDMYIKNMQSSIYQLSASYANVDASFTEFNQNISLNYAPLTNPTFTYNMGVSNSGVITRTIKDNYDISSLGYIPKVLIYDLTSTSFGPGTTNITITLPSIDNNMLGNEMVLKKFGSTYNKYQLYIKPSANNFIVDYTGYSNIGSNSNITLGTSNTLITFIVISANQYLVIHKI